MAVGLHVIARLQNKFAVAPNDFPEQTAGKWSFERAVADGTAGVGICCTAEVLNIVVCVRCRYVMCANVLHLFDSSQHLSFPF